MSPSVILETAKARNNFEPLRTRVHLFVTIPTTPRQPGSGESWPIRAGSQSKISRVTLSFAASSSMQPFFVALVRHGSFARPEGVPSAHLHHDLTPGGREEAREGATLLLEIASERGWAFDPVIDSSRLRRAYETAVIYRDLMGRALSRSFEIHQTDALLERSLGSAANLTERQIEEIIAGDPRYPNLETGWKRQSQTLLPFPGAESLLTAGKRVAEHVRWRMPTTGNVIKIFVGHGGAFRHAAHHFGVLSLARVAEVSMYCGRPVVLAFSDYRWQHVVGDFKPRRTGARHLERGGA